MKEYEYVMVCLLIPIAYVIVYIAGKYDVIALTMKMLADSVENLNRKIAYEENASVTSNGDRVRSMSDEELADAMIEIDDIEVYAPFCVNYDKCNEIIDAGETLPLELCRECLLKWLQSENK